MKRHIFLIVTALFCFMPQAKAQPVAEAVLGTVSVASSTVFLGTAIATFFDGLDSNQPDETLEKFLLGSGALTFVSLAALNMYLSGRVPF